MKDFDWKFIGVIIALCGFAITVFKSLRSRFGYFFVSLSIHDGKSISHNRNYKEKFSKLTIEITKKGYKDIFIEKLKFENENLNVLDKYRIDLNEHVEFPDLQGTEIKRNNKITRSHEFSQDSGLSTLFKITKTRAIIIDTKGKKYYSNWLIE